jgi:hypothetical protein
MERINNSSGCDLRGLRGDPIRSGKLGQVEGQMRPSSAYDYSLGAQKPIGIKAATATEKTVTLSMRLPPFDDRRSLTGLGH